MTLYVNTNDSIMWYVDTGTKLSPGWYHKIQGDMFGPLPSKLVWDQFFVPYLRQDTTAEGQNKINLTKGVMNYV